MRLIDRDAVQIAPPERDLWMVGGDTDEVLVGYTRATGRPVNAAGLALYRLWWNLADIARLIDEFRGRTAPPSTGPRRGPKRLPRGLNPVRG
ncbi:hypothetical protein [Micromonospora coerulea]|uniref:hypothetical protein n=1 Tax=Micromonospora coerulea TaxID=47856 RepID=UPI001904BC6D|nr:hypothetical protein [Micromonospora veneta]